MQGKELSQSHPQSFDDQSFWSSSAKKSLKHFTWISKCSQVREAIKVPINFQHIPVLPLRLPTLSCYVGTARGTLCAHQIAGGEGREGGILAHCFQPDHCSSLLCPTATLILAPTERRRQQKCKRRAGCFQPGTSFTAHLQLLWHRQGEHERARRCGDWCVCWIKQKRLNKTETFLAPLCNSWCKIIWVNLGSILPLNNDIAELGRDRKHKSWKRLQKDSSVFNRSALFGRACGWRKIMNGA